MGGEGGTQKKSSREITLENILKRKIHHPFIPPIREETTTIPSWAAERNKRKFSRRMDKAYHNINKLGTVKELESTIDPCDTTPHHNFKSTETRYSKQSENFGF